MIIRDVLFVLGCALGRSSPSASASACFWNECHRAHKLEIAYSLGACEPSSRPRETPRRCALGAAMGDGNKFFRKQAKKAKRFARAI
jgi:hypothetical protein